MSTRNLAQDSNNFPIQTLELGTSTTNISVAVASASAALPTGASAGDVVRIAANTDCYINWGTSGVTASSSNALFPAGVEIMQVPRTATHLAAIRVSADGVLTITEVF